MRYVAYYRVSTAKQGVSGLGLAAQEMMVRNFTKDHQNIIASFTEIESGKNNNRPELARAIVYAKNGNAKLVISKLDRLSRNAAFIFTLRDAVVNFVCADMPEANTLTIGIFAVLAQNERELISKRTREALQAKKLREPEWRAGTPANLTETARNAGLEARRRNSIENTNNRQAAMVAKTYRDKGMTLEEIAALLNREGFATRRGKKFIATSVKRLISKDF
ncbi:recombinase family protein [Sabulibacter ruber]|uniref:recombinase family protein n=1 Tax=Sabulibacter ruber TaxID=2811901 RepID=UPI001A96F699|nr:recombinase family protein [Sabulibacter ruber]